MGQVYQATGTKLNRQVALKILSETFVADPDRLARFEREAAATQMGVIIGTVTSMCSTQRMPRAPALPNLAA